MNDTIPPSRRQPLPWLLTRTVGLAVALSMMPGCGEAKKAPTAPPSTNSAAAAGTPVTDFKIPLYQGDLLRSVLSGRQAVIEGDVNTMKDARVELYAFPNGKQTLDVIVESPGCVYNMKTSVATSTNTISIRKIDGKFTTTGEGWEYQQNKSHLTIARHVHTVIRGDFLTVPAPKKAP